VDSDRQAGRPRAGLHHEPGRWVTSARFLLRSLNLRGPAFLLALLAVTVGATVTATVTNLKAGLNRKMSRELRAYGPNLLVLPAAGSSPLSGGRPEAAGQAPTLQEAVVERVPALLAAGVKTAPVLMASGSIGEQAATLVGVDFEALRRIYPGWSVTALPSGRLEDSDASGLVIGVSLAERAGLKPGDSTEIRARSSVVLRVTGVVSTGEAEDEQAFLPLHRLQELAGLQGRVSYAAVSIEGGPKAVESAAARLAGALPGVTARPLRAIALAEGAILRRLDRMMLLLTFVILVLSGLCLVTTLMSMVAERESEIGLARAIGAGDGEIFKMFLGEVGLLGLLGAIAGIGLGAVLARLIGSRLFGAPIEASLSVVPVVMGASILICLMAVLIPLRRALSIQPAAALRGE
jgi:putative ABC transport system permease protein